MASIPAYTVSSVIALGPDALHNPGNFNPGAGLSGSGVPWLLGSEAIRRYPVPFLRMSLDVLGRSLALYPHLFNWTDDRHTASHRWLRWLGFRLADPAPFGVSGLPFRYFEMRA